MKQKAPSLFDWNIAGPAIVDAFKKLNPRLMIKNPVMFVTMVGAALTTVGIFTAEPALRGFVAQLAIWLWFTVLFANFAEAVAEGRGKAQAASLRRARKETMARRLQNGREVKVPAPILQKGDLVVCEDGAGENHVVGITSSGRFYKLARNAWNKSEFAGACFAPDGRTLFVNLQDPGITFAIWGPWGKRRA